MFNKVHGEPPLKKKIVGPRMYLDEHHIRVNRDVFVFQKVCYRIASPYITYEDRSEYMET